MISLAEHLGIHRRKTSNAEKWNDKNIVFTLCVPIIVVRMSTKRRGARHIGGIKHVSCVAQNLVLYSLFKNTLSSRDVAPFFRQQTKLILKMLALIFEIVSLANNVFEI